MNFGFLPYSLNADLSHFQGQIQYISSENGVDLYKVREELKKPILGIPVIDINFYFFEGSLITVYSHLGEFVCHLDKVIETIEKVILEYSKILKTHSSHVYYWQNKTQFLGLMVQRKSKSLLIYHSLELYNIFNQYI